ncbi:hypothetical protein MMC22_004806 [Lobaria immixta]|nr:hypothetical protein [Lobaria immixta]
MHSYTLATVLVAASIASTVCGSNIVIPRALQVRQGGDAFIPGTRQGTGSTCVESFGPNSKLCADSGVCYDSSIGDSCCSEGYPCGAGSFCLIKGYCCPDGDTPVDCAAANGITLPADFGKTTSAVPKPATSAAPLTSSTQAAVTTSGSTPIVAPSSSVPVVVPSSSAPFPIPNKPTTTPAASGTISATGGPTGSSTLTPFTGAASPRAVVGGGALLALLSGVMAVLL